MTRLILIVLALVWAAPAAAEKIAIVGGTIHTVGPQGDVENGTVLIGDDGRIEAVLSTADRREGYRVIDASGKVVTPGLMSSFGFLGLEEVTNGGGIDDSSAAASDFGAALDVSIAINPDSTLIDVTRIEGITRAATAPKFMSKVFAGRGVLIQLRDGNSLVTNPRAFMVAELSEMAGRMAGGSRPAVWASFEDALREAEDAAGTSATKLSPDDYMLPRLDREALAPVIRGDMLLVVRVNRAIDIRQVIALKVRRPQLKLAILDGREGWRVADELAAADIPVILDPLYDLPSSFDSLASSRANAARLNAAGVTIAFSSVVNSFAMSHSERLMPQDAGHAVTYGLPWAAALEAMTLGPAKIFGIDAKYGSLEPGKDADVVVWDGDPIEVMTAPTTVIVGGAEVKLESRQTKLRDRYSPLRQTDLPKAYK